MSLLDIHSDPAFAGGPVARLPVAPLAAATLSVVVVDPHPPVRDGLSLLLQPEQIAVLGGASTGAGGEALIARHEPDIALIAADLPDIEGIALLRRLVARGLRSAVVLYADAEGDAAQAAIAMRAGAAGMIAKRRAIHELATALRVVAAGGLWFGEAEDLSAPLPVAPAPLARQGRRTAALSSSELRVLALVAGGGSTEATAEALSLSPHTVRTHLRNVMRKLEASSRAHAVAIAIRESAIEI